MSLVLARVLPLVLCCILVLVSTDGAEIPTRGAPPVTMSSSSASCELNNGIISATIDKRSGNLLTMTYRGTDLLASSHGYWSHTPDDSTQIVCTTTIDPATNGGERAEFSVKGFSHGAALGKGPGGSVIANLEIRYSLARGESGLSTYEIIDHPADLPATAIGEARYAIKLDGKIFDFLTIDAHRRRHMPTPADWEQGTPLNLKEARRMTTGIHVGEVEVE